MSTRKGTVVYLDDLIEEAEERALEEVRKRRTDLSEERMREIARSIGRGAVRYNIVRVQPEKPLVFKWEDALNFEGNSAPVRAVRPRPGLQHPAEGRGVLARTSTQRC